jgi:hypothetical protein
MAIMLAETVHGILRELFLAPRIGSLTARQIGIPVGCVIIFVITWLCARWMNVHVRRQFLVGSYWVLLTVAFEIVLGRAIGASWNRLLSDYNPAQGGFMIFGLLFMLFTPWLVGRLQK